MSVSIIKRSIIDRLNEGDGIVYDGENVPVIYPPAAQARDMPDIYITNPIINATFELSKGGVFNYIGTADLSVYARTPNYKDGSTTDVCELIRACLHKWTPSDEVNIFVPTQINELPPQEKYMSASITFDWRA